MRNIRLLCLPAVWLAFLPLLFGQISTITTFAPSDVDTLPPLYHSPPDGVAKSKDHYFAFYHGGACFQRAEGAGHIWEQILFDNPYEFVYAMADVGDAVLIQTHTYYFINDFEARIRIYRIENDWAGSTITKELLFDHFTASNFGTNSSFNVVSNSLIYYSFAVSDFIPYDYRNFISSDNGMSWTELDFSFDFESVRQSGNLFAVIKEADFLADDQDSVYWSLSPTFSAYTVTTGPPTEFGNAGLEWMNDTLFWFSYVDTLYFTAAGGLLWEKIPFELGGVGNKIVHRHLGQLYLGSSEGLFQTTSVSGAWTPVYQYEDCFNPKVYRIYLPEQGLPWVAGAATALLRPDATGANWEAFDEGLPGFNGEFFRTLRDTLTGMYDGVLYQTTTGTEWLPFRSPGLNGVRSMNNLSIVEQQGSLFAPAVLGAGSEVNSIFVQPAGEDWRLLDTFFTDKNFFLRSDGNRLYRCSPYTIHRSSDGGQTWQNVQTPPAMNYLYNLLPSGDTLLAISSIAPSAFWRSFDGGQNWESRPLPTTSFPYLFRQGDRLVLATAKLFTWISDDWGNNWSATNQGIPSQAYSVSYQMLDDILVAHLSIGNNNFQYFRGVLLSKDFGAHWLKLELPVSSNQPVTYGFERYGGYFYYGSYGSGNYRFRAEPVLQKLEEITPKVATFEPGAPLGISLSPNPAGSETWLRVAPEHTFPLRWQCFNAQGQMVLAGEIHDRHTKLEVSALPNGVYWLSFPELNRSALKWVICR